MPSVPPAITAPNEYRMLYPARCIAGSITLPMASMVTMDEPEMAAKMPQLRMEATARPPGRCPVSAVATSIRRFAVEPLVMTPPHRMNIGIDRISSLSSEIHMSSTM